MENEEFKRIRGQFGSKVNKPTRISMAPRRGWTAMGGMWKDIDGVFLIIKSNTVKECICGCPNGGVFYFG